MVHSAVFKEIKMKVAIFSDCYVPTKNGVVTVVSLLYERLRSSGHEAVLVVPETAGYSKSESNIYRIKSVQLFIVPDQRLAVPNMHALIRFLREKEIDLIHCHTEFTIGKAALRAAKILRKPCICTTHTMWVDFYKYYVPFSRFINPSLINSITKRFYGKFNALIAVSAKAKNYYKQDFMLPDVPSVIIPNALDASRFTHKKLSDEEKNETRKEYGIAKDSVVLLFLGRLGEEKRVSSLLRLCKRLVREGENVTALFVGDGPALEDLKYSAKEEMEAGKIVFTGFVEWKNVYRFYAIADIFVTASLSEMHSMTILEAEASSLPIIVRQDESYAQTVYDGENGYLCGSDEQMYERMKELCTDEKTRKRFAARSLEIVKTFNVEAWIKKTLVMYRAVLSAYPDKIDEEEVEKEIYAIS